MKRAYYTDPLAAEWNEKHHAIRIGGSVYEDGSYDGFVCGDDDSVGQFYISAESMSLLEPQVGDVIFQEFPGQCSVEKIMGDDRIEAARHLIVRGSRVIQRDGKPFHWPEFE